MTLIAPIAGLARPVLLLLLALGSIGCTKGNRPPSNVAHPTIANSDTEEAARAAFQHLVDVSRKQDLAEFKKLIRSRDLQEMEAMNKERPGLFEMMMALVAADDPKDFTLDIQGPVATFTQQIHTKTADLNSRETTTVTLVREGDRWQFGKPR